jgi:hypothetical protein
MRIVQLINAFKVYLIQFWFLICLGNLGTTEKRERTRGKERGEKRMK